MFVSAAAASLEDTGEEYLNVNVGDGTNGAVAHINTGNYTGAGTALYFEGGKFTPTANNNGYTSPEVAVAPPDSDLWALQHLQVQACHY